MAIILKIIAIIYFTRCSIEVKGILLYAVTDSLSRVNRIKAKINFGHY